MTVRVDLVNLSTLFTSIQVVRLTSVLTVVSMVLTGRFSEMFVGWVKISPPTAALLPNDGS